MPLASTIFAIIYSGLNCTVNSYVGKTGKHIKKYVMDTLIPKLQSLLTTAYLESRLRSSWKNHLGELQQQTMSLEYTDFWSEIKTAIDNMHSFSRELRYSPHAFLSGLL